MRAWLAARVLLTAAVFVVAVPSQALAAPGAIVWSQSTSGSQEQIGPTVVNGVAYYPAGDSTLRAWNATTGTLLWSRFIGNSPTTINGSPVVANGMVYVGRIGGGIYAINTTTGAIVWSQSSSGSQAGISPTVVNGVAYYPAGDSTLRAWNATTGTLLWSTFIGNYPTTINGSPVVTNGMVYVGRTGGGIYAVTV